MLRPFDASRLLSRAVVTVLPAIPAGLYSGVVDAYLLNDLTWSNTLLASETRRTWTLFHAPFPPEHRLFEQYLQLACYHGQILQTLDRRRWFRRRGLSSQLDHQVNNFYPHCVS